MSSLSLHTPSLSLPSSLPSLSSAPSPSSSSPASSSPLSSNTPITITTTITTPSSTSSLATPSSTATPNSALSSTSSTPAASAAAADQQPYSSSTPTAFATTAGVSGSDPSASVVVYASTALTPSPTATKSSPSESGFFSNTGAVASTFIVVGLVGIAGVIAVALLIIRRRHSRSYGEEDMEYLDKTPDISADPSTTPDDGFPSDHGHYVAPQVALTPPAAVYYPDHAYALHPQAFSAGTPASHGYPPGFAQDYVVQHIHSPDNYDTPYPHSAPRIDPKMPNPHEFADVELDSAPVPPTQTTLPDALRPSVRPTSTVPKQWAGTRFSVDSFYAGIATDNQPPSGRAL